MRRLVAGGADAGVFAPAQAFDTADLLEFPAPFGVTWSVELEDARAMAAA